MRAALLLAFPILKLRGWLIVLKTSESIWQCPVFAFICCVSIHLENLCDGGAICSRRTPIGIRSTSIRARRIWQGYVAKTEKAEGM